MKFALAPVVLGAACTGAQDPIVIELGDAPALTRTFEGDREIRIVADARVVEAWAEGGAFDDVPSEQLATGAAAAWLAPRLVAGELVTSVNAASAVTLMVWNRGTPPPAPTRERSLAWFDPALLDDPNTISFARVMAAISDDGHGGVLLDRWFRAFAAGPGAGRATFAQFLTEVAAAQGSDPGTWDLAALPFRVTGVHNRFDLPYPDACGELRVSVASTHPTFSPVHLIFLFRQPVEADDQTPDGVVHCRGSARRWAQLAALAPDAFALAARDALATVIRREQFEMAESVELTISPWQWRQWSPDGRGGLVNPALFQTIDVERVNTPGATRDAFLADVRANAPAIMRRTWTVPPAFRSAVAEVQPNAKAALPDLTPLADLLAMEPELPRSLGMIGCPRCHTDNADFIQTSVERKPSPFYDRELDARATRLDALAQGAWPGAAPFGPLQPL